MPPSRSLFGGIALTIALVGLVTVSYQGMRSRLTGQVGGGSGQCAVIQEFPVPAASGGGAGWLETLAVGPDGNLWYGGLRLNTVGRMTPSGTVTEFPLPTPGTYVRNIVAGPDGNLWFTVNTSQNTTNTIGKITPAGVITEYPAPAGSGPYEIVKGPDGNLWFTQAQTTSKIGKITTGGVISEYTVPPGVNVQTLGMTVGPDGHLWFTRNGAKLGRVSTSGTFSEYPLPGAATGIGAITSGPDDHLWYAGYWYTKIGKMSTSGTVAEFTLPTHQYQGLPTTSTRIRGLTAGPDGNVWYAGEGGNGDGFIGRVTPAGTIDEYPVPTANGAAGAIITGPDNAIWFTEFHANKIGRLSFGSCPGSSSAPASSAGQCGVQNPAYQLFNDSTMADASWDWTQVDPAHPASVQGYQPTGGNPGSWRKITHAAVGPSDVTLTGTMNRYKNASFNPQTEQFISASLTMDAFINAPASSNNLEVGLVAHQNGTWFRKVGLVVGSTWQIFETSVTAAELQAGGIDLSPSGAPITFGFETGNGYVEANNVVGVDKVAVKIISSIRCSGGACLCPSNQVWDPQLSQCRSGTMACPLDVNRVCGCNGVTYPNACEANRAGVRTYTQGSCPASSAASSTPKPDICYPKCGDGIKHALEECDDGNTTNGDGCSSSCKREVTSSAPSSRASSTPSSTASSASSGPVCGNGRREFPEECDDGNKTNGDCCSSTCKVEPGCRCFTSDCKCPAGQYWSGTTCIAGTRNCSTATSNIPVCGCNNKTYQNECFSDADGVKRWTVGACGGGSSASSDPFRCAQGATCDKSIVNGQCIYKFPCPGLYNEGVGQCGTPSCGGKCVVCNTSSSASSTPVSASCGNGKVESPEECDDGNTVNGDGCSSTCKEEGSGPSGWYDPDLLDISRATTILYNGNPSGNKDTCRSGTDAFIEEQYTTGGVDVPKVFTEQCPLYTKCVDGACLGVGPTPSASERECTDSDDDPSKPYRGFNIFVAGTARRGATSDSDLCYQASFADHFETLLQETYCRRDGQVAHLALRCPSGMTCSNGACQP